MARQESDREDLLREATALRERIEWRVPDEPEPVVVGLKSQGGLVLYFGADPVYQFDSQGRLRRACVDGFLFRTQGTTLARLHRERTGGQTVLIRHDLNDAELQLLLDRMLARLRRLLEHLNSGGCDVLRSVSAGGTPDFPAAILAAIQAGAVLAPAIPGRK